MERRNIAAVNTRSQHHGEDGSDRAQDGDGAVDRKAGSTTGSAAGRPAVGRSSGRFGGRSRARGGLRDRGTGRAGGRRGGRSASGSAKGSSGSTIDFALDGGVEGASHSVECEFGRESESRELRLGGILECEGLKSDEVEIAAATNGGVRSEHNGSSSGNIDRGGDSLERCLTDSVSDAHGHLRVTELLEGNTLTIVLPGDGLLGTSLPSGGSNGGSDVDSSKSGLGEKSKGDQHGGEHLC